MHDDDVSQEGQVKSRGGLSDMKACGVDLGEDSECSDLLDDGDAKVRNSVLFKFSPSNGSVLYSSSAFQSLILAGF